MSSDMKNSTFGGRGGTEAARRRGNEATAAAPETWPIKRRRLRRAMNDGNNVDRGCTLELRRTVRGRARCPQRAWVHASGRRVRWGQRAPPALALIRASV